MDILRLKGMHFYARHGYFEEEKEKGNEFEVDVEFKLGLEEAALHDRLSSALDYIEVYDEVATVMSGPPVDLIETLCFNIGEILYKKFKTDKLSVTVRKLRPPLSGKVIYSEICMEWPR